MNCYSLEEEGIEVACHGVKHRVYFAEGLVIGDNLGIHQLCGFEESFSANYYCESTKRECEKMTAVDSNSPRTVKNYDRDLQLIFFLKRFLTPSVVLTNYFFITL